ncbi:hypothetical protein AB0C98_40660 [Streptomyces sp. NPDC048558]|uniref:hypothetical protein n=1 Tax=Streptomyces sp. NPDC048558 TaxID=3155759 RepID=UPI00343F8D09
MDAKEKVAIAAAKAEQEDPEGVMDEGEEAAEGEAEGSYGDQAEEEEAEAPRKRLGRRRRRV